MESFGEGAGDELEKILIAVIVLCEKDETGVC